MTSRNDNVLIIQQLDDVAANPVTPAYLDLRVPERGTSADDKYVTVTSATRLDVMGLEFLLDATGWWAILDLSGVVDPFVEVQPTVTLRVPSTQRYQDMLSDTGSAE